MTVLLVHNSADFYGASRSLLRLCTRLKDSEFEAKVLLPCSGPLVDMLRSQGTEVLIFPSLRVITRPILKSWTIFPWVLGFLPSALALSRLLKRHNIQLVHTNTGVICSSALASRLANIPHIWHIRDWFQEFGVLWKPYSRYILAASDLVYCVSNAIAGQFPPSPKVSVLHNGFDTADFPEISEAERAQARERWGFAPGDFVLGTVGRIKFVRKGQEFLLRAVQELRRRDLPATALLVGGNPPGADDQLDKMQSLACELGVADHVRFAGELTNPRPAYAAMDAFVLPSAQPEPFGGVVMEAMALALPVIGTNIGGTPDQIVDGQTGWLVPPADPLAIVGRAASLIADRHKAREMGSAGRRRIATQFSLAEQTSTIQSAYRRLLNLS